ncbi:hypothetical protein [Halomonas cerina]|uniref:Uncharacterized protein n=1 Tax=Halomonas cerina TaxID=447424 RepID=A0A839VBN5_9GAMM|nr:hypothetical protein [Halomonas cerina]MBB3192541.1 hypothetical protein [Halomonas cerina]
MPGLQVKAGPDGEEKHRITITHGGTETIVSPEGTPFTFTHDELTISFTYFGNQYDANRPQDCIYEGGHIIPEWKLSEESKHDPLPLLGPFTVWRISVESRKNPGLDISGIDEITLEFLGEHNEFP